MMTRRDIIAQAAAFGGVAGLSGSAQAQGAKEHGYFYPEESTPHERSFMQWPVSRSVYPERWFLSEIQKTIAEIANVISEFEPVVMLMDAKHAQSARRLLGEQVEIWDIATEDLWARDSGPSFVIDGQGGLAMTHFNFNGWGNKQVHSNDGKIAKRVAKYMGLQLFDMGLAGEPGGAEADGEGTLIAHESSWVNTNRNKGSKSDVEHLLLETFGADKVIWAPGLKGQDITDYHIDALACFTKPGQVVIQMGDVVDPNDPWSRAAFETYEILQSATDATGRKLDILTLSEPLKPRVKDIDFVASYVNSYICNGAVIASQFGDRKADEAARDLLTEIYPDRELVMLNTDPLGMMGGGIHCATHEQPKV